MTKPTYDDTFYQHVNATARYAAARIVTLLSAELHPLSVLDVGCGQGAWLAEWRKQAVSDVVGVDGDYVVRDRLQISPNEFCAHDLKLRLDLGRTFDLVQCLEVAEHLPAPCADTLIDSLTRHGKIILFSAAPPGQGGHDHINERAYDYWCGLFQRRDYLPCDFVRPRIIGDTAIPPWYRYNPLLYVHRDKLVSLSVALQASRVADGQAIADLAPMGYRLRRLLIRCLPVPAMTFLARAKERMASAGGASHTGSTP